jgi:hypothetical protein
VNTPIFTCVRNFTKMLSLSSPAWRFTVTALIALSSVQAARADWTIDFSRRASKTREQDLNTAARPSEGRAPASVRASDGDGSGDFVAPTEVTTTAPPKKGVFDTLFDAGEPMQELVILHTEKGFVPAIVRVRKGGRYKVSVVNVNEREKNVSFILDGFSEHHATYYGKVKTFTLEPKKEGTYSFQSPETSSEGKLVVFNPQVTLRAPASEE